MYLYMCIYHIHTADPLPIITNPNPIVAPSPTPPNSQLQHVCMFMYQLRERIVMCKMYIHDLYCKYLHI